MKREHFIQLVEEVLDSLPKEFRERIHNLAILVEDWPRMRRKPYGLGGKIGPTRPAVWFWEFSRVCLPHRKACSTFAPDRTASSSTRKISRQSAGATQKSVMRSGRPCSTN